MANLIKRPGPPTWYIQHYVAGELRRECTGTQSLQIAKEKLRQFESARARREESPFPTKTSVAEMLSAFAKHLRAACTPKSAQTDLYSLCAAFGPVCVELEITSHKLLPETKPPSAKHSPAKRKKTRVIETNSFQAITTAPIAAFITDQRESRDWPPKTANRCREVLTRMFNWAMSQHGIRLPAGKNPAAAVKRYKEPAPGIRFLSLSQIDRQINALADELQF